MSESLYRGLFRTLSTPCTCPARGEAETGLLVRGISVNGNYLLTDSCTVFMRQEVEEKQYIYGGPRMAVANIGKKDVEGEIRLPMRMLGDGTLEPGVYALLRAAEKPNTPLTIATNHAFSYPEMTADGGGTSGNLLLTFDCLIITSLKISATPQDGVTISASVKGTIDARNSSELVGAPPGFELGRKLSFADCDASRWESAMRSTSRIEVAIENKIEMPPFLMASGIDVSGRSEQPSMLALTACHWSCVIEEIVRVGGDPETLMHGGWMQNENLRLAFGPVSATLVVPLTAPAEQPLTANIVKRTTQVKALVPPSLSQGGLFQYPEGS